MTITPPRVTEDDRHATLSIRIWIINAPGGTTVAREWPAPPDTIGTRTAYPEDVSPTADNGPPGAGERHHCLNPAPAPAS